MRILYISDVNFSSENAPPIHVKAIVNNLSKLGNKMFLIAQKTGNIGIRAKIKYLRTTRINVLKAIVFNLKLFFILPKYIKKNKIDAIYTRQSGSLIAPTIVSWLFSIPFLTEVNGNMEEEMIELDKHRFFIKINNFVEELSYNIAKKIIVMTPNLKRYLIKKYKIQSRKIIVIENGVDSEILKPLEKNLCKSKLKLNKNYYYLCYVGNFTPWQGLESLIKSFKESSISFPNIKLLLIGDGKLKDNLVRLSKDYGLENKVIFVGKVKHKLISYYIGSSEICFAPFTKERNKRMGNSAFKIYEYASCGKPIITTHPNFVTKNKCGLIAEAENPEELAKKTIHLLNNPRIARKMGKNGRKAILKSYSWGNVAEITQKLIKKVIKENKNENPSK